MTLKATLLLLILIFPQLLFAGEPTPGRYQIDASSRMGFSIVNFLVTTVVGEFHHFSGEFLIDPDFQKSHVLVDIDIDSVDTDNKKRDDHLRSADFFDAKNFPKMHFESISVEGKPEDFKINGKLSIRSIPKDVTFSGKFVPAKDKEPAHFLAEAKIDRQDFEVKYGSTIKDRVKLLLKIIPSPIKTPAQESQ